MGQYSNLSCVLKTILKSVSNPFIKIKPRPNKEWVGRVPEKKKKKTCPIVLSS